MCLCQHQALSPWLARPVGAACRAGGGRPSPGGVSCHRCEGRLASGAVPPPAARPLGQAAGVPRPVCPGCSRSGRGDPDQPHNVRPCGPALPAVGVAEGRNPGRAPFAVVGGVWGQGLPLTRPPALWACCRGLPPTCCGPGCADSGARHCPLGLHALWRARAAGVVGGRPRGDGLPPL